MVHYQARFRRCIGTIRLCVTKRACQASPAFASARADAAGWLSIGYEAGRVASLRPHVERLPAGGARRDCRRICHGEFGPLGAAHFAVRRSRWRTSVSNASGCWRLPQLTESGTSGSLVRSRVAKPDSIATSTFSSISIPEPASSALAVSTWTSRMCWRFGQTSSRLQRCRGACATGFLARRFRFERA